jgi:hypothetical protein
VFYRHRGAGYQEIDEYEVKAWLYAFLEKALTWHPSKRGSKSPEPGPFKPTKSKVENLLDALRAVCNLPGSFMALCWLEGNSDLDRFEILPCSNGLLHIPTRKLLPSSARFFTLNGLNFEYSPAAAQPQNWFNFLHELWPDDLQSQQTLQEWIGYLLTPRTAMQKICMLIGPKRSGKGTIARVTRMLLGDRNVCGPTLSNMGEQFGLSILVGKTAAIIADALFRVKSAKRELADLPRKAARWAKDNLEILRHSSPEFPNGLNDRQADNWEPLLAIADLVGGEWPERARKAALALSGSDDVLDERIGPQLLADLRMVFGARTELWTKDILTALHALPERPWSEWSSGKGSPARPISARALAQLLRPYRIKSQQVRIGSENNNGYTAASLADAWDRYIPRPEGDSKGLQGLHADIPTSCGDFYPLQNPECRASELPLSDCEISNVEDVEDGRPPSGGDIPSAEDKTSKKGRKEGRI